MTATGKNLGFTLMEVMIGVFLSTLMMTGMLQLLSASVAAYRLQLEQARMAESGRYALNALTEHISQAGYHPRPWLLAESLAALSGDARNGVSAHGDQLGLQRLSSQNCYGVDNPVTDEHGRPAFYLLQSRFRVNAGHNLAFTCRYGPDDASLVTQINNFGLVEGVENLQVLYAEDQNGDRVADHWVDAGSWKAEQHVIALKVALLLTSLQPFDTQEERTFTLLEEPVRPPADGHLRRVITLTSAIRGRSATTGDTP
jgi:type IV pilus assembly protein PilW